LSILLIINNNSHTYYTRMNNQNYTHPEITEQPLVSENK
jgi:hypothetical protein